MSDNNPNNVRLVRCVCFFCRHVYYAQRSTSEYCSGSCKQKAYRWRSKITSLTQRSIKAIEKLSEYLDYDKTTDITLQALREIRASIADELLNHNVKAVK